MVKINLFCLILLLINFAPAAESDFKFEIKTLSQKCDMGDLKSCTDLGTLLWMNIGNLQLALKILHDTCLKKKYPDACLKAGMLVEDVGIPSINILNGTEESLLKDDHEHFSVTARVYYITGCSLKNKYSCGELANNLLNFEEDVPKALMNYKLGCDRNGDEKLRSYCNKADEIEKGILLSPFKEEAKTLSDKCDKRGDLKSCTDLGMLLWIKIKNPTEALKILSRTCMNKKFPDACFKAGMLVEAVKQSPEDIMAGTKLKGSGDYNAGARMFYMLGCNLGDKYSCGELANNFVNSNKDLVNGLKFYQLGCDKNGDENLQSYCNRADEIENEILKSTPEGRLKLSEKECAQGNWIECDGLISAGGLTKNVANSAKQAMTIKCGEGEMDSCVNLGDLEWDYFENIIEATKLYTLACNNNFLPGCNNFGVLEETVNRNIAAAEKLYLKACFGANPGSNKSIKSARGCFHLGDVKFQQGELKEAENYLRMACEIGKVEDACQMRIKVTEKVKEDISARNIANREKKIPQNIKDPQEAINFYIKSCGDGDANSCNNLGDIAEKKGNIPEARKWLNMACDAGSNSACERLMSI